MAKVKCPECKQDWEVEAVSVEREKSAECGCAARVALGEINDLDMANSEAPRFLEAALIARAALATPCDCTGLREELHADVESARNLQELSEQSMVAQAQSFQERENKLRAELAAMTADRDQWKALKDRVEAEKAWLENERAAALERERAAVESLRLERERFDALWESTACISVEFMRRSKADQNSEAFIDKQDIKRIHELRTSLNPSYIGWLPTDVPYAEEREAVNALRSVLGPDANIITGDCDSTRKLENNIAAIVAAFDARKEKDG